MTYIGKQACVVLVNEGDFVESAGDVIDRSFFDGSKNRIQRQQIGADHAKRDGHTQIKHFHDELTT